MSIALYSSYLAVLGASGSLDQFAPYLTVRPEIECMGPNGIISDKPRSIPVDPVTGAFQVTLFPSNELTGTDGRVGVKYVLELALFDTTTDRSAPGTRFNLWTFTAAPRGGEIKDMGSGPALGLYFGPPWPAKATPGMFINVATGDFGVYMVGSN